VEIDHDPSFDVVHEDGTYGGGHTLESALNTPLDFGTYTIEGNIFTYFTEPDASLCARLVDTDPPSIEGIVGVYEIGISEDGNTLYRHALDDDVTPSATRY
jgi:hypothetical protein